MRSVKAPSSVVGVEQAIGRRRCIHFVCATYLVTAIVATSLASCPLGAQARVIQTHRASAPEGRLLAYYSAAMVYTSLGASAADGRWSAGLEGTWIPALSESQRRPGIDKPETTNLAPLLPRPRLTLRSAWGVLEGSWVPPITVGHAKANLFAFAAFRTVATWRGIAIAPRLSLVTGRVQGAITCNARTAQEGGQDLATYYAAVCHGRDSDDWFEPRLAAGEVIAARALPRERGRLYVAAGARIDRSRFDIGVVQRDGSRDPDHPILRLSDTRAHLAVGVRARLARRVAGAAEWFYAPGSMATLRTIVAITGGR